MRILLSMLTLAVGVALNAACIPRDWCKRNGLTDAQIAEIFAKDQNAIVHLTLNDWRGMKYQGYRYLNVTNWLDICGETNNFAALSYDLQGKNFQLTATNLVLVATNQQLEATCVSLANEVYYQWENYTNQLAQTEAYSNLYVIVSAQAQAATAKIQDEIADLQAKVVSYEEDKQDWIKKMPLFEKTITKYFDAKITDAENRIKILQALTGSAK